MIIFLCNDSVHLNRILKISMVTLVMKAFDLDYAITDVAFFMIIWTRNDLFLIVNNKMA